MQILKNENENFTFRSTHHQRYVTMNIFIAAAELIAHSTCNRIIFISNTNRFICLFVHQIPQFIDEIAYIFAAQIKTFDKVWICVDGTRIQQVILIRIVRCTICVKCVRAVYHCGGNWCCCQISVASERKEI